MNNCEKNIRLYKLYELFFEPLFWGPILILYMQDIGGMTLAEIYMMEAVIVLLLVVLEVPTGALADLIGRKTSVVLGSVFMLGDIILFAMIAEPIDVWIANIVWVIGFSLVSGAASALLYDSLKEEHREGEARKIVGAALGNRMLLVAVTSLMAGYLYELDPRLPLLLSIPFVALAIVIATRFHEARIKKTFNAVEHFSLIKMSVLFVANHRQIKWIIAFSVTILVVLKIWFFTYNPYFLEVDVAPLYFGIVFAAINVIGWIGSRLSSVLGEYIGEYRSIVLICTLITLPLIIMSQFPSMWAILLLSAPAFVRGFIQPFLFAFLHRHLSSHNRATVVSIKSAIGGVIQFVALLLFGLLLEIVTLTQAMFVLGVLSLISGVMIIVTYRKIFL